MPQKKPVKFLGSEEKKLAAFFIKLALIWLSWKGILFILGVDLPAHERLFPTLSQYWEAANFRIARFILEQCTWLLNLIGYETYTSNRLIWIADTKGLKMGNYCIGIQLMYYYTMLMLITPLRTPRKIAGIVAGIVVTFALNIVRISSLCLVSLYHPEHMYIAHDHIFNVIVFGTLIGIYYRLTKRVSATQPDSHLPETATR